MDEVENQAVEQEAQEVASPTTETTQDVSNEPSQEESRQDRNWREIRRVNSDLERKVKMQEELLQRVMTQQPPQSAPVQKVDLIHEISQEEYVPGNKVAQALQQQKEEFRRELEEVKKTYSHQKQNSLLNDLKREFPDFDDVVNPDTIAILDETNPRLANAIASSNDPYMIAVQTYEYIKAKGLAPKAPSKRAVETERKIEQNKKTINTPQAFEKRPMAQAFAMTDAMKKELRSEMYGFANQAGGY